LLDVCGLAVELTTEGITLSIGGSDYDPEDPSVRGAGPAHWDTSEASNSGWMIASFRGYTIRSSPARIKAR